MDNTQKMALLQEYDVRIGSDFDRLAGVSELEAELLVQNKRYDSTLPMVANKAKNLINATLHDNLEKRINEIEYYQRRHECIHEDFNAMTLKTESLLKDLEKRTSIVNKLNNVQLYLKSLEDITALSGELDKCDDDETLVSLFVDLKKYNDVYTLGHRGQYLVDLINHHHLVLKQRFGSQYEDVLKAIKWPFTSGTVNMSPPSEIMTKFNIITRYLLLSELPESFRDPKKSVNEREPCLPLKILLKPLKKRFSFHFMTTRQTARLDRPEWFLTQTLNWIYDHGPFLKKYVQPIVDKLQMSKINVEREFHVGLLTLAANRLNDVMEMHWSEVHRNNEGSFAHCVDEILGFHKELLEMTGMDLNIVLQVLTKAQNMVKWLAIEKKYALSKMEEALSNPLWMEPVAAGVGAAVGSALWVPKAADWFITMLKTMEERYILLPQPGHKLQFLELQLELLEEWRVRLIQLLTAAQSTVTEDTFTGPDTGPHALTSVINCAHYTRQMLLQWAHSLMYLQMFYYRKQFSNFTKQQHADTENTEADESTPAADASVSSLGEVEKQANELAELASEYAAKTDQVTDRFGDPDNKPIVQDETIWGDAPDLLMRLRDMGLYSLADHIALEFKAAIKEYKTQKWHAMMVTEEMALSVSPSLCRPLAGLCARLHSISTKLPTSLCIQVRAHIAAMIDNCLFDEVVLGHWWNDGGIVQLNHDVHRNIIPIFTSPSNLAVNYPLPKMVNACTLLDLDYDDARRLKNTLQTGTRDSKEDLLGKHVLTITVEDALHVISRRMDLFGESTAVHRDFIAADFEMAAGPGL